MKLLSCALLSLSCLGIVLPEAAAAPAIICTSDSTGACKGRQYCCHEGMDSSAGDKYCKDLGCKRGGTSSCPTAANVTSCGTRDKATVMPKRPEPKIPWCIDPADEEELAPMSVGD